MKRALALFFVRLPLYCFSAVFVYGQTPSPAPPRGDTQLWNEMEVMLPLNKKADEVFYDSRQRAWIRNRFSLGVIRKFNNRLTGEFYYTRHNDGFSRLGDVHVIGTTLRVRLK